VKPICIIPARGGSKRLPRKNTLPFRGKPLMTHVISAALKSNCFDSVVVSSDDVKMLSIAAEVGASPHERPRELGQDKATVVEVCLEALDFYEANDFCCIYATAALITENTITRSCECFFENKNNGGAFMMGVSRYEHHPVQAIAKGENGFYTHLFPEYAGIQSQFYPDTYVSNGTLYWAEVNEFKRQKTFYGDSLSVFEVSNEEVCDIDNPEDYQRLLSLKGQK